MRFWVSKSESGVETINALLWFIYTKSIPGDWLKALLVVIVAVLASFLAFWHLKHTHLRRQQLRPTNSRSENHQYSIDLIDLTTHISHLCHYRSTGAIAATYERYPFPYSDATKSQWIYQILPSAKVHTKPITPLNHIKHSWLIASSIFCWILEINLAWIGSIFLEILNFK